jgi:tRNA uridine 5-carbamoylmethylation protein Kti12
LEQEVALEYKLDDIAEIAGEFAAAGPETQRNLILIAGLPGVGKTTFAREFVKQTDAVHFEIDEIKRNVVPKELVAETIDPPEYRYQYYVETIRRLPELFARSQSNMVVID